MTLAAPIRRHRSHTAPKPPPTEWDRLVEHRLAFEAAQEGLRLAKTCVSTVAAPYYLYSVRTNRLLAVSEGGMTLDEVARYLFR
ncbi:hypothetical protein GA0111570_10566 [Raineyella antarctica]|uniref:Uncharacterized protein n=1 Tax=Raineyella antarctica TaxID=1577474 RepID=A0A1G6GUX4_9ACTN|nr:hypothetical protein [Raineyella antarctica]SDB85495.1 hypothetical protein GA0111570_10566 [Raineyella antarctica]